MKKCFPANKRKQIELDFRKKIIALGGVKIRISNPAAAGCFIAIELSNRREGPRARK